MLDDVPSVEDLRAMLEKVLEAVDDLGDTVEGVLDELERLTKDQLSLKQ